MYILMKTWWRLKRKPYLGWQSKPSKIKHLKRKPWFRIRTRPLTLQEKRRLIRKYKRRLIKLKRLKNHWKTRASLYYNKQKKKLKGFLPKITITGKEIRRNAWLPKRDKTSKKHKPTEVKRRKQGKKYTPERDKTSKKHSKKRLTKKKAKIDLDVNVVFSEKELESLAKRSREIYFRERRREELAEKRAAAARRKSLLVIADPNERFLAALKMFPIEKI